MLNRFRSGIYLLVPFCWILLHTSEVNAHEYFDIFNPLNTELDVRLQFQQITPISLRSNVDCVRPPNFYTCEELPNLVPSDTGKTCNYRNVEFHEQIYRWVAGQGCLVFTHPFLFVAGFNNLNLSNRCLYGNLVAPCIEIPKEDGTCGCYPFDPGFEEVVEVVRRAMVPTAHGRWERCFQAASDCCSLYMAPNNNANTSEPEKCRTTFDAWTCWQPASAGTTVLEVCSEFAYSNEMPSCHHFSSKECFANATWNVQTEYSTCSLTPLLLSRYRYHIGMMAFSIATSLPAVIIFFLYKRLRITRVTLHRNLLIAIIVRNILVIISRTEIYIDAITNSEETVLAANGVWCRLLSVAERVASNAVFICMLVEGVYLHRLIVAVFRQKLNINLLYGIGAAIAVIPVVSWAAVMAVHNDHSCWVIFTVDNIQWIMDAPRLLILLINTLLFIDVLRVLLTKIRNSENAHQLSTAKTTLFLMPIFGTQFLLTAFRPNTDNCTPEQIYFFIAYTVEGLQGFLVALLYCYINKEVHMLLKATYIKTESAVVSRVRRDSNYPRMSVDTKADRRITYSTAVHSQNEDPKDENLAPQPHVTEIISVQASERLAGILEPVYETIENGVTNDGYDSFDKSSLGDLDAEKDSRRDTYQGFTNFARFSNHPVLQDSLKDLDNARTDIATEVVEGTSARIRDDYNESDYEDSEDMFGERNQNKETSGNMN